MLFGTHARLSDADFDILFTCKGRPNKRVFEFKYLGVVFDEHISWNSHVSMYYPKQFVAREASKTCN